MNPIVGQAPRETESRKASSRNLASSGDAPLLGLLLLGSVLPYVNTLFNGFVYDDFSQVMGNPYIRSFHYVKEIFGTTVWSFLGAFGSSNYYRPMMTLSYLVCYQLFGLTAFGFHLVNVLLHAAVVSTLYLVTKKMFEDRLVAGLAAGLFALHPIHTESVAWVAAVTDLQLTLFYLMTFGLYVAAAGAEGRRASLLRLGMAGSFVLAMLSKEQALTLPALATVYEHFYRSAAVPSVSPPTLPVGARSPSRPARSPAEKGYAWLWVLSGLYLLFRVYLFGGLAPVLQRADLNWSQVALSAIALVGQYLWKLIWPAQLCAFYVFHPSTRLWAPRVLAGLGGLGCCAALFVWLCLPAQAGRRPEQDGTGRHPESDGTGRRARLASFGLVWLLVTLAPVLNARWMAGNVFTERYLYLPSVGFCWIVGWALARSWVGVGGRAPMQYIGARPAIVVGLAIVSAACVLRIVTRNHDWQNDILLFTRTLAVQPDAWQIHNNLGVTYWRNGDARSAEREWREALRIQPDRQVLYSNLGLIELKAKRYEEALRLFQRSVQLDPKFAPAFLHLGEVYEAMDQSPLAESQYRAAVALSPLNFEAHSRLGQLYLKEGRWAEAEDQFQRSIEIDPKAADYLGLGEIDLARGRPDRAEAALSKALALEPFNSQAHFKLAQLYARAGRKADAIREYRAGLLTDPNNAEAHAALSAK